MSPSQPLALAARAVAHELAAANVHVTAVDVMRGPRLASLVVSVASSQCVTRALQMAPRLEAVLGGRRVRVTSHGFKVIVETPLPKAMWTDLTASMERPTYIGESRVVVVVGLDARGLKVHFDFSDPSTPHLFVVGATGSGKTTALQSIVWQLATSRSPDALGLVLIDGLASGLAPFARLPHLALPLVTSPVGGADAIATVGAELDARIADPQRRTPLVVVVDELAEVIAAGGGIDGVAGRGLARIAATGRGLGVHLIAATQHATATVVNRLIAANITARLVGRVADDAASRLAMGCDRHDARSLLGTGDMLLVRGESVRRVQVARVTDAEWAMLPQGEGHPEPIPMGDPGGHPDVDVEQVIGMWRDGGGMPGIMRIRTTLGCGDSRARRLRDEAAKRVGDPGIPTPAGEAPTRARVHATTGG